MNSKRISSILFMALLTALPLMSQVVIQRCDETTGWQGSAAIGTDQAEKKEGVASLSTQAPAGEHAWFTKQFARTQTGIDESGYLLFWLYVSDASQMEGGQVQISSSGGTDDLLSSWYIDKSTLSDGWNFIELAMTDATPTGGGVKLDSVNFFQITQNLSAGITAKIDHIRFAPMQGEPTWPVLDVPEVDASTLDGKVMFGYQGWFNHPDDGAGIGWVHWTNFYEPFRSTVDMYPDFREYGLDELYDTDLTAADGRMAPVYSSFNRNSVVRHMKWVRDYNLDGVFMQRFISSSNNKPTMNHKDTVTTHVMEGCEKYGRVFAIMYDGIANKVDAIKEDWMHLVDDIGVTDSERYLSHRDLPLVALWGYTVREEATLDQLVELIDWFRNNPDPKYRASLLLGVAWDWYDRGSGWTNAFKDVQVISPWFSGSTDYDRGQAWCDQNNVDYLPVVHPGFSWHNLYGATKNATPREGGNFLWSEVHEVVSVSAKSVYIAMFDEVDEGTAMFKLAENDEMIPQEGYWLPLDEDGYDLPSDWYLRAATLVSEVVRGYEDNHPSFQTPPEGIMTIRIINEVNGNGQGGMEFIFPDFPNESTIEISIDGGNTYAYTTADDAGSFTITGLMEDAYQVMVRHGEGGAEVDMGDVNIGNAIELAPEAATDPYPADGETAVRSDIGLSWGEGAYVHKHVIYFGTDPSPDSIKMQASPSYLPGDLEPNTTYYWRIDEVNAFGTAEGPLWSFTTGDDSSLDFIVFDYCDASGGWNSQNGVEIDTEEKKEGFASLKSEGGSQDWFTKRPEKALKTYCDTSSYLDLWVYVSDVSKFNGGGQLEISSSGGPDTDEYNWSVGSLNLQNGWNELHLKIGNANVMGTPDLNSINFFRFYQFVSEAITVRVDFIRFSGLAFEPLAIPQNLSATAGDASVQLDWDDNTESSLAGYDVYRSRLTGLIYSKVNDEPLSSSEYLDTDVDNGVKYYYKIKAVDQTGNESGYSDIVAATPEANTTFTSLHKIDARIYPNPMDDFLQLQVEEGISLQLYDLSGRLVKRVPLTQSDMLIPVGDLQSGAYILELHTARGKATQLIVKN